MVGYPQPVPADPHLSESRATGVIDPYVQNQVGTTCGNLYKSVIGRLDRYPIPSFPLAGPGDLLDIGCGWGRWTIAAARSGFRAVGVDPEPDFIAAAERVAVQLGVDPRFVVGESARLPFADASFDAVFSFSVLQHLTAANNARTFEEIRRVLRPGGLAMVQLANSRGVWNMIRSRRLQSVPMLYYSPSEMRGLGSTVGPTTLEPDAYFTLNGQRSDLPLLPISARVVVVASEALKLTARVLPIGQFADSVWVLARRSN